MKTSQLLIIGTGGTIAGIANHALDHATYQSAQLGVHSLLSHLGRDNLDRILPSNWRLETKQLAQIDSKDMNDWVWQSLATCLLDAIENPDIKSMVITHGTDTLEETAFFLHLLFSQSPKPIILTCAMRPSTSVLADGTQNLLDAISLASNAKAKGVMIVCAGKIHDPVCAQKTHNFHLDAFESGSFGLLGEVLNHHVYFYRQNTIDFQLCLPSNTLEALEPAQIALQKSYQTLIDQNLNNDYLNNHKNHHKNIDLINEDNHLNHNNLIIKNNQTNLNQSNLNQNIFIKNDFLNAILKTPIDDFPSVEIIISHAGSSANWIQACKAQNVRGLVIAGTGNATIHEQLETALEHASKQGLIVWLSSRCSHGLIVPSQSLKFPFVQGLNAVKTRIYLMLFLLNHAQEK